MYSRFTSFLAIFAIILAVSAYGQEIGKIISAEAADKDFGSVSTSILVQTTTVEEWLAETNDKIMFMIENDKMTVLGDSRNVIFSATDFSDNNQKFHMLSKIKVSELIMNGNKSTTFFEMRDNVFTVTNGEFTLEFSTPCPPFCD